MIRFLRQLLGNLIKYNFITELNELKILNCVTRPKIANKAQFLQEIVYTLGSYADITCVCLLALALRINIEVYNVDTDSVLFLDYEYFL